MARNKFIADPSEPIEKQERLFEQPGYKPTSLRVHPDIDRSWDGFLAVLNAPEPYKGIDLEFMQDLTPTVVSVTTPTKISTIKWSPAVCLKLTEAMLRGDTQWVAHSGISADRPVVHKACGIQTKLENWEDSLVTHYLCNQALTKAPQKDESDDSGVSGFMNLWAMASITTDLYNWKGHRGEACDGPCPKCLRGESLVWLPGDVKLRINQVVKMKYAGNVLCVVDGKLVERRVTNWFANKRLGRPLVRVTYRDALRVRGRSKHGVVLTIDHPILTKDRGYVDAGDLQQDELICTGTADFGENAKKFMVGLLLGDAAVGGGGRIVFGHCAEQLDYLKLKKRLFINDAGKINEKERYSSFGLHRMPRTKNLSFNFLNNWREWVSSNFTFESLVALYLDDGCYHKYQGIISVKSYTPEERVFLASIFSREFHNLEFRVNDNLGIITIPGPVMRQFYEEASPYTSECVRYKIGHPNAKLQAFDATLWEAGEASLYYSPCSVHESQGRINWNNGNECDETVYCIEVEEANNFITEGGVVHNCDVLGYCALDSWSGLVGFLEHKKILAEFEVPWQFYREQIELAELCEDMHNAGIKVDVTLAKELDARSAEMKEQLFAFTYPAGLESKLTGEAEALGLRRQEDIIAYVLDRGMKKRQYALFNPRSPKQVQTWFAERGVELKSIDKENVLGALEKRVAEEAGYTTLKDWEEEQGSEEASEPTEVLSKLYDLHKFKTEGKSFDAWFGDKYVSKDGFIHPRLISVGASTGRLSSASPNTQNIPRKGFGELVRCCIIPRDPALKLVKADFKQLELRCCLYLAGVSPNEVGADAFTWLVNESGGQFAKAAEIANPLGYAKKPETAARDIAKATSHSADYLEGFQLLDPIDLQKPRILREIEVGARRVYTRKYYPQLKRDWTFQGKVVSFTGVNRALALFGDKSFESRAKALAIQEDVYFKRFWMIREWHMKVTADVEDRGYLKMPTGTFVNLYGRGEDRAKVAVATLGQGVSAHHVQAIMLKYRRETGRIPLLQVHDELVWEMPVELSKRAVLEHVEIMQSETWRLPDFSVPSDAKWGPNWKDLVDIE